MPFNPPYALPGPQVQEDAKDWGNSTHLPKVPTLKEMLQVTDPLRDEFPPPSDPRQELEELHALSRMRDDLDAFTINNHKPISKFLQVRPQPVGAVYNRATAETNPVITTGRELARWFETETPGLGHRHALNFLLPQTTLTPPAQARVWAALDVAIYAALLAAWHYKWTDPATRMRPRPIEIDPSIDILFNTQPNATGNGDGPARTRPLPSPGTPRHPAYPSGHSTVGAAGSTVLAYFFPEEIMELDNLADNSGMARLWGGIHYRSDHEFGMAVGRAVAELVIADLEHDGAVVNTAVFGERASLF